MSDNVNHPAHYTDGKYETIEFIERNMFDYHDGNAIKYISRAGKKDPSKTIEDLEKAVWYIKRVGKKLSYDREAVTVHDYILDKKLSPALASALALIEAGQHEEAAEMLEAEIRRLKEENEKGSAIESSTGVTPYRGKVVCISSGMDIWFTPGRVYEVTDGFKITTNGGQHIYLGRQCCSVQHLNFLLREKYIKEGAQEVNATFIEFKGET